MFVLQNVQRDAHKWGVGDSEDITRLETHHSNEGNGLSPLGDEMLLNRGQVRLGHHVNQVVPNKCR